MANRTCVSHDLEPRESRWTAKPAKPRVTRLGRCGPMGWCLVVSGLMSSVLGGPSRASADETGEREPRRAALVAGVNKYRPTSRLSDLHFAEQDARDLSAVLREAGYDVVELTARAALTTQEPRLVPTAAYLRDELERLLETPDEAPGTTPAEADKRAERDAVLICLHGHGIQLPRYPLVDGKPDRNGEPSPQFYFCAADTDLRGVSTAHDVQDKHNLIPLDELFERLKASKAGTRLLVVDACRNDPSSPPPSGFRSESATMPQLPPPPDGLALLLSCRANERAIESRELGHGVFTHYLIEGLRGRADLASAGESGDSVVTLSELASYVGSRTRDHVRKHHRPFSQSPEMDGRYDVNVPVVRIDPARDDLRQLLEIGKTDTRVMAALEALAKERAQVWSESAQKGHAAGLYLEAQCLSNGYGGKTKSPEEAFATIRMAAEKGLPVAKNQLGLWLATGYGTTKNETEALKWYREAAAGGSIGAMWNLGSAYEKGLGGLTTDPVEAASWYRKSADAGYTRGMLATANCYKNGYGVAKSDETSFAWCKKAAEAGNAVAANLVAIAYFKGNGTAENLDEALRWYRKAVDMGSPDAMSNLAFFHLNGKGVPKDAAKAAELYRKASDLGNVAATNQYARMLQEGVGVPKDLAEAAKWYALAADRGLAAAQYQVAVMLFNGTGVAKDLKEAAKRYRQAAEQDHHFAQAELGICLLDGLGVDKNVAEGIDWLKKSTKGNSYRGLMRLAKCHDDGIGVAKDEKEAFRLLEQAANAGSNFAQNSVGFRYENGLGVAKNDFEAVKWYRKAAEGGSDVAQCNLGLAYLVGRGVKQDDDEARVWFEKAAALGNQRAKEKLATMSK